MDNTGQLIESLCNPVPPTVARECARTYAHIFAIVIDCKATADDMLADVADEYEAYIALDRVLATAKEAMADAHYAKSRACDDMGRMTVGDANGLHANNIRVLVLKLEAIRAQMSE